MAKILGPSLAALAAEDSSVPLQKVDKGDQAQETGVSLLSLLRDLDAQLLRSSLEHTSQWV